MTPLHINIATSRYRAMIGVGGIGSGMFFVLDGNQTLGREESRSGRFLDRHDYCKLHIVSHYVKTLLGPDFDVLPIGRLGADEIGARLLAEMQEAGLDTRYVERVEDEHTLFSLCFIYPDGCGGNLTSNDSASARVDASLIERAECEFVRFAKCGFAVALPEVPLAARLKLLDLGTRCGLMRVASFTSAEISGVVASGWLPSIDLLAMNLDEAAAASGMRAEGSEPEKLVAAVVTSLSRLSAHTQLSITAGSRGSWAWDGAALTHTPAFRVRVVSTAGAGDAHLAGTLVGLTAGLTLPEAQELGALVAALSITSPHTIDKEICRESLHRFTMTLDAPVSNTVEELLQGTGALWSEKENHR